MSKPAPTGTVDTTFQQLIALLWLVPEGERQAAFKRLAAVAQESAGELDGVEDPAEFARLLERLREAGRDAVLGVEGRG
jgi:hypothetical protein